MTRQFFHILLSILLVKAGLPQKQFNTLSFNKEAATSAKAAHICDVHIQAMGRWQSNANELYIKTPPTDMASFSKFITQQGLQK